jgi:hypothetical protein
MQFQRKQKMRGSLLLILEYRLLADPCVLILQYSCPSAFYFLVCFCEYIRHALISNTRLPCLFVYRMYVHTFVCSLFVQYVCMSFCNYINKSVCMFVYMSVGMSVTVSMSVCLPDCISITTMSVCQTVCPSAACTVVRRRDALVSQNLVYD